MENQELTQAELATNAQTWEHINLVMKFLASAQIELMRRQFTHDRSKLVPPEVSVFTEFTPKLKGSTYGSEEYKGFLKEMGTALEHHYTHNRHHPEYFEGREPSQAIAGHIAMSQWAQKHGQVLPDDVWGYKQLIEYLEVKQKEHQSSINNMNLFDLIEMIIDWLAEINRERFDISDQLMAVLENTVDWLQDDFDQYQTQKDLNPQGKASGGDRAEV